MTSLQSSLDDPDIAEELAAQQRQISIAEFFEKNKQMLGFDSEARALVTAVKEAVDNALDATEEASIAPDIYVTIREVGDYYRLIVEDNGPGITKEQIPNVFGKLLYGSRFHVRVQARGQQGIGISAAVLYAQLTSGKPAKITSRTKGSPEATYFELIIDTETNEPEISAERTTSWDRTHGTRIELEMEANMRARKQLLQYIKHTAIVNPHARLTFDEPRLDEPLRFERANNYELPAETEEIRPHPHGVELGTLLKMLDATDSYSVSGFLQTEFTRVGNKTANDVVGAFRDRHFGREMAWQPPQPHQDGDIETAIIDAVANKSADATEAFASYVIDGMDYVEADTPRRVRDTDAVSDVVHIDGVAERDRLSHSELADLIMTAGDVVEREFQTTFGATVREHALTAAWTALAGDPEAEDDPTLERRVADVFQLVDAATSARKDEATLEGLADRLVPKLSEREAHRATKRELRRYVDRSVEMLDQHTDGDESDDGTSSTFGETARNNVVESLWRIMRTVSEEPPKVREMADDRDAASELLEAMRSTDIIAPPTDCLSPITAGLIEAGLRKEFAAEFYEATTRDAEVHGGDPFIVEAGIAYGGELEEGTADVIRFANRVPLVYQRGACATTDVVKRIDWRNYNLEQPGGSGIPAGPVVIMVHVASTNVPFTSESKDAIANLPEIEDEIELAIREVARQLKAHLNKRRSLQKRRQKQSVIADVLPKMAEKVAAVTGRDPPDVSLSLARVMNNVLVNRQIEEGRVELVVENNTDVGVELDVTEMVSVEPQDLSAGTTVDMDDEWFVKWAPTVGSGESATLAYRVNGDGEEATFDIDVEGIEAEKLTIQQ